MNRLFIASVTLLALFLGFVSPAYGDGDQPQKPRSKFIQFFTGNRDEKRAEKRKKRTKQLALPNDTIPVDTLPAIIDRDSLARPETEQPDQPTPYFSEEEPRVQSPEELDSLLSCLNSNNTVASFETFFDDFIDLDTTEILTSSIPDSVYEARLRAIFSPIGMPFNPIVKQYIIAYTTTKKATVSHVLARSQYYFPIIENELIINHMPLELRMLPVVESALSPIARSRVGAMGLWQFMYGTGKHYGMEITSFVDQRCDPVASTRAACRYLSDLYDIYGDWTLAIAAYNCGPGNVNKAFKRAGEEARTYWDIYPYLPRETRGYVPSFIAATYAYTYHKQHGIDLSETHIPLATDTIVVDRVMHLEQISSTIDIPIDILRRLNPQYTRDIIPALDKRYVLVLPQSQIAKYLDKQPEIMAKDTTYLAEYLEPSNIDKTKQVFNLSYITHRVKSGENLGIIARKYGVTVKQIVRWNNLRNPNSLRVGQQLEIHR